MRYPPSEKLEIIQLVEQSHLPAKRTLAMLGVKRFLGVRSDLIFTAIKRIRKDITKSLNADAIAFFKERGVINDWEYGFLQDTMAKRQLSAAQMAKRRAINEKILSVMGRRGFRGPEQL